MNYKNTIFDIIIIGSGPTGLYGAFFASLKHLNTLVLEINNTYGGAPARLYPEKPLYDIPGCVCITGAELVENMYKQLSGLKHWEIKYNTEVKKIIKQQEDILIYELIDQNNEHYLTKNIIFATGYGAFEFISFEENIKLINNPKISFYVHKLNDYKNKNIVICGGGDSAVDFANALKDISKQTYLIHRRNEFRAKQANVEKLKHNNVILHLNKSIKEVHPNHLIIHDNETNEQNTLNFDELIVLYGTKMIPNNIELTNLYNKIHKIEINPLTLETINYEHIYACGLANNMKHEQTIITGISDIIKVIACIYKDLKA